MSQEYFDANAKHWNHMEGIKDNAQRFKNAVDGIIPLTKDLRVLDFGCGAGVFGLMIMDEVQSVSFQDISEPMINALKEELKEKGSSNYDIFCKDIREVKAEPYDVIYALLVMHHIHDLDETLRSLYNILKPGGKLAVGEVLIDIDDKYFKGCQRKTEQEWVECFEAIGFTNSQIIPIPKGTGKNLFAIVVEKPKM